MLFLHGMKGVHLCELGGHLNYRYRCRRPLDATCCCPYGGSRRGAGCSVLGWHPAISRRPTCRIGGKIGLTRIIRDGPQWLAQASSIGRSPEGSGIAGSVPTGHSCQVRVSTLSCPIGTSLAGLCIPQHLGWHKQNTSARSSKPQQYDWPVQVA